MAQTRRGTLTSIFFGNVLTQYLRQEKVDKDPRFDMSIPTAPRATDIACIRGNDEEDGTTLITAEPPARDDNVMAHLYGMMDLKLRIGDRPTTPD